MLRCPGCKVSSWVHVSVTTSGTLEDEDSDTEQYPVLEMCAADQDAMAECSECEHEAPLKEFNA